MSKTIETPPKKWMAHKLLHPCNFNGLFMEKIDVVVLLHLPHFWSCIQPVFSLWKLTLLSFCIWHTFGVASNLSFHGENWRCHSFAFGTLLELHPTCLFMEKIDVVVLLYLAHFWSCIQPVFSWCKLTLSSFCIWHTFGVACNLWAIYRGSPTYAVFTTAYPTKAVFGLWMHKWGVFTLGGDSLQSY